MHGTLKLFAPFAAALAIAGCNAGGSSVPRTIGKSAAETPPIPQWQSQNLAHRACPDAGPGEVQCELLILNKSPQEKELWMGRPRYRDSLQPPLVEQRLGADRCDRGCLRQPQRRYGPRSVPPALRFAKAKFYKYNQDGQQGHYPKGNTSWCAEIDLDVEMVSAGCPNCTIYLIESNDSTAFHRRKAEREAVKLGAHVISNSFMCAIAFRDCHQNKAFESSGRNLCCRRR